MARILPHSAFEKIGPHSAGLVFDFDTGEVFLIRDNEADDFWGVALSHPQMATLNQSVQSVMGPEADPNWPGLSSASVRTDN